MCIVIRSAHLNGTEEAKRFSEFVERLVLVVELVFDTDIIPSRL